MRVEVAHSLAVGVVAKRLTGCISQTLKTDYPDYVVDAKEDWKGHSAEVDLTIRGGIPVIARLDVTSSAVVVEGTLPWIARLRSGVIEQAVRETVRKCLADG